MAIGARLTHSEGTQDQCFCSEAKLVRLFCVCACVCAAACVEGMLACSTSCLLIHGILILRWQRRGSEDRQAAPEQAERIRGLA